MSSSCSSQPRTFISQSSLFNTITMSSSLDRSLGDIIASNRKNRRESGKGGAGGIRKRPQRAAAQKATAAVTTKSAPKAPAGPLSDKIIVSNLVRLFSLSIATNTLLTVPSRMMLRKLKSRYVALHSRCAQQTNGANLLLARRTQLRLHSAACTNIACSPESIRESALARSLRTSSVQ